MTEIIITPAAIRAARTARGERGYRREVFNVLTESVDSRTSLQRWELATAASLTLALRRKPPSERWMREVARAWALGVRGILG